MAIRGCVVSKDCASCQYAIIAYYNWVLSTPAEGYRMVEKCSSAYLDP